jgi:hypothetical protein
MLQSTGASLPESRGSYRRGKSLYGLLMANASLAGGTVLKNKQEVFPRRGALAP